MSVLEIVLVFGLIPAGIIAVIALLIFLPGAVRVPRYRPGRPWPYRPVWYLPHPAPGSPEARDGGPARALPGPVQVRTADTPASVLDDVATAKGGAHGSW